MTETTTVTPPAPGTEEWRALMTASKVASVLGVSPWTSAYTLWRTMRGDIPTEQKTSAALDRGSFLEDGIIDWWMSRHPEVVSVERQFYATRPEFPRYAATLDGLATTLLDNKVILEVKTAARGDDWGPDGSEEIPVYYRCQVAWQLFMYPEAQLAYVAALLGPGLELREYVIERDEVEIEFIAEQVAQFMDSLAHDVPPEVDGSASTYASLRQYYPKIEADDSEAQISHELAREYVESQRAEERAIERARRARSEMLSAMGDARYARYGKQTIARRQPSKGGISLYRAYGKWEP